MNFLEALKKQVNSRLSSKEPDVRDLSKENTVNTSRKTDSSTQNGIIQRVLRELAGMRLFGTVNKPNTDGPTTDIADGPMNQQHNAQMPDEQTITERTEILTGGSGKDSISGAVKDAWNQGANKIKGVVSDIGSAEKVADSGSIFAAMKGVLSKRTNPLKDAVIPSGSTETAVNESTNKIDMPKDNLGEERVAAVEKNISDDETEMSKGITAPGSVAIAGSVVEALKNVLNKGMDTVKDTAANIDMAGSVEAAKNALDKGTGSIKEAATSLSTNESIASITNNILNKGIDSIKETKAIIDSTDSLTDAAKNIFSRKTKDDPHRGVSETIKEGLQKAESVARDAAADVVNVISETTNGIENGVVGATDKHIHSLSEERSISDRSVSPTLKTVEATTSPDPANAAESSTNEVAEAMDKDVHSPDYNHPQRTTSARPGDTTGNPSLERVEEDSDAVAKVTNETARMAGLDLGSGIVKNTVDEAANEVVATPVADIDTPRTDSTPDRSTLVTAGNTFDLASAAEKETGHAEAEDLPKIAGLDSSTARTLDVSGGVHRNLFDVDKAEDTVILGSDSSADDHLDVLAAPAEKSGFRWVFPVVFLSLLSVAVWWLSFGQTGQQFGETDFAMVEATSPDRPEANPADLNTDFGGFSSAGGSADTYTTAPETTSLAAENEPAEIQVIDNTLATDSKDIQEVASISDSPAVESEASGQATIDTPGSASDTALSEALPAAEMTENISDDSSPPEAVAMAHQASAPGQMSAGSIAEESMTGSPVDAIMSYLESDDGALPKRFILHGLNFRISSSRVSKDSAKIVSDLAVLLETYPSTKIRLEGFTDDRGNPDKNLALSTSRAKAVKAGLASLNVDPMRIVAVGLGKENPIADNETKVGQWINRRVELVITDR